MPYSTIIGIDAHARTNVATAIIPATGETRQAELPAEPGLLIDWIGTERFPAPVMAVYGSGSTGYPLARALAVAGIACSVWRRHRSCPHAGTGGPKLPLFLTYTPGMRP
ncbi:MAG: hypothetical protein FWE94_08140 [Coriobacteriia bacterium]|nr:hypothetical protein [Coriobacteriia bacterium]